MVQRSGAPADDRTALDAPDAPDLTVRRIMASMAEPSDFAPGPEAPPGPPEPSVLTAGIQRMRERRDLFGFVIAPRRRVVGMRGVKRLLRRLQQQTFAWQSEFNAAVVDVLTELANDETGARRSVRVQAAALANAEARIDGLESRLGELGAERLALEKEVARQRIVVASLTGEARPLELDYVGLQAQFRGDPAEVLQRQRLYVDRFADEGDVLDIGCGRGEFLGLLREAGITARGVDADLDMVQLCRAEGFDVAHEDGLAYFETVADRSLGGVFAAQLIEHLPPTRIVSLLQLAHRKLRPGGVIVLETVNPTSLVALMNFYLDFTHVKPVHPLALEWLAHSLGFADGELVYLAPVEGGPRLHELPADVGDPETAGSFNAAVAATNEVLYGPRDYALIARRP